MSTLGELKTNIYKVLCEYSKNGEVITPTDRSLADTAYKLSLAIDMASRRILTECGLLSAVLAMTVSGGSAFADLPDGFVVPSEVTDASGKHICNAKVKVEDGKIYLYTKKDGNYSVAYKKYPDSVVGKADNTKLPYDDYIADIITYAAAAELCDTDNPELYAKLKNSSDELLMNRYNTDKLKTPPFNRAYSGCKKRGIICHS